MSDVDTTLLMQKVGAQLEKLVQSGVHLGGPPPTSAGGPGDGGMEARIAKLESDVSHIASDVGEIKTDIRELRNQGGTDFRLIFGAIIAVALGLAGLMVHGFGWLK